MSDSSNSHENKTLNRRTVLGSALIVAGAATSAMRGPWGTALAADPAAGAAKPGKRYSMKKSINLWAFPYPDKMTLEQCLRLAKDE